MSQAMNESNWMNQLKYQTIKKVKYNEKNWKWYRKLMQGLKMSEGFHDTFHDIKTIYFNKMSYFSAFLCLYALYPF